MKKIFIVLFSFFVFLGVWNVANSLEIFDNPQTKTHYCADWECGLLEWIYRVARSKIDGILMEWTASEAIQDIIVYVLWFLKLIAIIIIIYAWFRMLTSAWNEEEFKKSKMIVIYAIAWLALIYLAWPITTFIIWIFS